MTIRYTCPRSCEARWSQERNDERSPRQIDPWQAPWSLEAQGNGNH